MKIKYHAKFLNPSKEYPEGTPFEMPNWTPKKHERALVKLTEYAEKNKMSEDKSNGEFKYFVIHETFIEIDSTCEMEKVRNLHPITLIEWFNAVYNAGREGIVYVDFHKGRKTRKPKK